MSTTAAPTRSQLDAPPEFRFTPAHVRALPLDEHHRYELVDGCLLVSAAPSRPHAYAVAVFEDLVNEHLGGRFAYQGNMDQFYVDDSVLIPDVLVFLPGGPDPIVEDPDRLAEVVVEVTSPTNRRRDLGVKRDVYDRNGLQEYWIVDLQERRIVHHRRGDDGVFVARTDGPDDEVVSDALDGFRVRLTDLEP